MKKKVLIPVLILLFYSNTGFRIMTYPEGLPEGSMDVFDNNGYTLVRSDDNINIYTKWIPVNSVRKTRLVKVEFVTETPAENVISLLCDENYYTKWMQSVKTYYRLKTIDENNWYAYVQFSISWPLNNQDCILKYELYRLPDQSCTMISLKNATGLLKTYRGVERISHMEGCWIIKDSGNNKTKVEYYVCSNQAPKFPTWITDPIIQRNLLKTMQAFKEIVLTANHTSKHHEINSQLSEAKVQ